MERTGRSSCPFSLHLVRNLLLGILRVALITPNVGPYVTSVGGTNGTSPERAAFFSGGGFSNYFSRPSYQSDAVSTFLDALGDEAPRRLFEWVSLAEEPS